MRRQFRHRYLLALAALLALVLAVLNLDRTLCVSYIEQHTIARMSRSGLRAAFRDFSVSRSGLQAEGLSLFHPRYLTGFELEKLQVVPSLLSMIRFKPSASFNFQSCSGSFSGSVVRNASDRLTELNFSIQNFELSNHQQLNGLGFESGRLSARSDKLKIFDTEELDGDITIEIKDLRRPQARSLPLKISSLPFPVQIPAVSNLDVSMLLKFTPESAAFEKLVCKSQIGNFYGSASVRLGPDRRPTDLKAEITANLNDDGYALLKTGSQLVRHSGNNPLNDPANAAQRNWRIKVHGLNPPEFELKPD